MNSLPEEGVLLLQQQDMTPWASGAKDQSEQSEASTDKLIVKMNRPSEACRLSNGRIVRMRSGHLKRKKAVRENN
jgi:hypothetical protein